MSQDSVIDQPLPGLHFLLCALYDWCTHSTIILQAFLSQEPSVKSDLPARLDDRSFQRTLQRLQKSLF